MKFTTILVFLAFAISAVLQNGLAAKKSKPVKIKFAVVAPEGSAWVDAVRSIDEDIRKKTDNAISFKLYVGGSAGDEKDVIRKMKINQIHCAGFTGNGLGEILPMIRVLELPMLFGETDEIDFVTSKLRSRFNKEFEKKGKILLGWAEAGSIYVYSKKPIASMEDMKGVLMWVWETDKLAQETFKSYNVSPIALSLTDVMTALHTDMINAFYSSPLAAIAFQWFTKVQYITNLPFVNGTGAILMNKRMFNKLSAKHKKLLRDTVDFHLKKLVKKTREDNLVSLKEAEKSGITLIEVSEPEKQKLYAASKTVWEKLSDDMYPKALLEETKTLITKYRTEKAKKEAEADQKAEKVAKTAANEKADGAKSTSKDKTK